MQQKTINLREFLKLVVASVCIIGTGGLEAALAIKYFLLPLFGPLSQPPTLGGLVFAFMMVTGAGLMGTVVGIIVCVIILRPFVARQEMEASLTQPAIPVITAISRKIFVLFYGRKT